MPQNAIFQTGREVTAAERPCSGPAKGPVSLPEGMRGAHEAVAEDFWLLMDTEGVPFFFWGIAAGTLPG